MIISSLQITQWYYAQNDRERVSILKHKNNYTFVLMINNKLL